MNIEFSVEEYFHELMLMDEQYGQEEELYPWIYILLQMVECRKREILKTLYRSVSIRDVHNLEISENSEKLSPIKKNLRAQKGVPDIAILNTESSSFLGCIEIKSTLHSLCLDEGNYSFANQVQYIFNTAPKTAERLKQADADCADKLKTENGTSLSPEQEKLVISKLLPYITEWIAKDAGNKNFKLTKFSDKPLTLSDLNKEITVSSNHSMYYLAVNSNNLDKESIKKDQRIIQLGKSQNGSPNDATDAEKKELQSSLEQNEDLDHYTNIQLTKLAAPNGKSDLSVYVYVPEDLEKFKKVLYTNGLVFFYLILQEAQEKDPTIQVRKIADLTEIYNSCKNYYQNEACTESLSDILLSANAEWDKLISGLTSIDWHKAPVAPLNSASKENNLEEIHNAHNKTKDSHH